MITTLDHQTFDHNDNIDDDGPVFSFSMIEE